MPSAARSSKYTGDESGVEGVAKPENVVNVTQVFCRFLRPVPELGNRQPGDCPISLQRLSPLLDGLVYFPTQKVLKMMSRTSSA